MVSKPRGTKALKSNSPATQPAATQPAATQPAATQPAATQPAATQPAATQPAAAQPAATQPAATQPAATQPAATQPAATQPAATILPGQQMTISFSQPTLLPSTLEIYLKGSLTTYDPPAQGGIRVPNIPMPKCADLLLSLIGPLSEEQYPLSGDTNKPPQPPWWPNPDEITALFEEYFSRGRHYIFPNYPTDPHPPAHAEENTILDRAFTCRDPANGSDVGTTGSQGSQDQIYYPPRYDSSGCCLPCSCVTLAGNRRLLVKVPYLGGWPPTKKIRRLFLGDLVWLFLMERMGIFAILHALLSDFAHNGKYYFDVFDTSSIILNTWVELVKTGMGSQTVDRESAYERCLGLKQAHIPRKTLTQDKGGVKDNCEMIKALVKFSSLALEYYRERQAIEAIQGTITPTPPTGASLEAIRASIVDIKVASKAFEQGRNMIITLYGIVEIIATLGLLRRVRGMIPLPQSATRLEDLIPNAIDKLGLSSKVGRSAVNTFHSHHEAARDLRDLLLDLEVLDFNNLDTLKVWLALVEDRFQGARKALIDLTGRDLLKPEFRSGNFRLEEQVCV
jgi:hypothetical protein